MDAGAGGGNGGSGYFVELDTTKNSGAMLWGIGKVGGQGGKWCSNNGFDYATAGNGGTAGAGGTISYSKNSNIYAFNGSMNVEEQSTPYYEYNCIINADKKTSVTQVSEKILNYIKRQDDKEIIPTKIFAQTGIIRETYTSNCSKQQLEAVKTGEHYEVCKFNDVQCIVATYLQQVSFNNYTNSSNSQLPNQGIGSRSWIFRIIKWNFHRNSKIK